MTVVALPLDITLLMAGLLVFGAGSIFGFLVAKVMD